MARNFLKEEQKLKCTSNTLQQTLLSGDIRSSKRGFVCTTLTTNWHNHVKSVQSLDTKNEKFSTSNPRNAQLWRVHLIHSNSYKYGSNHYTLSKPLQSDSPFKQIFEYPTRLPYYHSFQHTLVSHSNYLTCTMTVSYAVKLRELLTTW